MIATKNWTARQTTETKISNRLALSDLTRILTILAREQDNPLQRNAVAPTMKVVALTYRQSSTHQSRYYKKTVHGE